MTDRPTPTPADPSSSNSRREIVIRCREPFALGALFDSRSASEATSTPSTEDRAETLATESDGVAIVGIASSTSVDSHGTEMSLDALSKMADQMRRGVPLLPRHNNGNRAIEWDEVVGRTTGAEIERADVVAPGAPSEVGYRLRLTSTLYADDPMTERLLRRLDRGEPIGQSIGGWFLSVRVVESDAGEIERVIVEDVELDHVALTRAPSNPDSIGLASLRSRVEQICSERGEVENRHIIDITETESEYLVRYAKAHDSEGSEDEVEDEVEDRSEPEPVEARMEHGDEEDERMEHGDEEDERATPESIAEGDFVSFLDSEVASGEAGDEDGGGVRYGRVSEVITEGSVDGSPVEASEADPLLRIEVYGPVDDGFEPTGDRVVYPVSVVEKIDPLSAPSETAEVESSVDEPVESVASEDAPEVERAVAPFVEFPTAPPETPWEWDAEAASEVLGDPPDFERFASVHLYFDPDRAEVRDGYKLPVAKVIDGEIHVVLRGLVAAVAALNGARGGVDLSDEDRLAAYERAVEFYSLFEDAEPPPLRSESDEDRTDDRSSADQVDMHDEVRHDTGERVSPDARSEPPTITLTSEPEIPMTLDLDALRAMIREEVARGTGPTETRAAEPTPSEPAADLRSEVEILRATVARLSAEPVRRGLAYQTTRTSGSAKVAGPMTALVERSKSDTPAVALVVERSVETLDSKAATPRDLVDALSAVLRTAEGEGLLGNPNPARWA